MTVREVVFVMIGDSPSKDVRGADSIGMRAIWLKTDAPETDAKAADAVAELPKDILEILAAEDVPVGVDA